MNTNSKNSVTIKQITQKLWAHKSLFVKVWIITLVVSAAYIFPQPRIYSANTLLAPEIGSDDKMGGLSALASSFGFNIGNGTTVDAIYPTLYPELISSNDFIVSLFDTQVQTIDGKIKTDLYSYILKHQKVAFYKKPIIWIKLKLKKMMAGKPHHGPNTGELGVNSSFLTEEQFNIVEMLKGSIICTVDPLTSVIFIKVNAQDPLVAANMADSVCTKLQEYIIKYRTSKSRVDVEHYTKLVEVSRAEYHAAAKAYSDYYDTHRNISLQTIQSERDKLEMEMSMALNKYQAMTTQLENANAKLQEETPAFTTLQNASVPLKPAAPKRVFFCLSMLMLATIVTTAKVLKDEMYSSITFFSSRKSE